VAVRSRAIKTLHRNGGRTLPLKRFARALVTAFDKGAAGVRAFDVDAAREWLDSKRGRP
jgi:hypothetical protein